MIYRHSRVLLDGWSVAAQASALTVAGAEKAFRDAASGTKTHRLQFRRVIKQVALKAVRRITVTVAAIVLGGAAPVTPTPPPSTLEQLLTIANSAISIAVFSTFIAAFAGTWGAQLLAERTAKRKELLHEISGVNAALGFAFNIANTYIVTKKQHIRELVKQYEKQCADRQAHYTGVRAGTIPANTPFTCQLELKTISPPFCPIEGLQKALLDRITPDGRALILLTPLIQCIQGFADAVAQRNAWINEVKNLTDNADSRKMSLYFGLPYAEGRVDDRYPELMKAIKAYTDDCIGFSILISESIKKYGERLGAQYGRGAPKIAQPDFSKAGDLLPNMKQYSDWTSS
jgi:hypothetical protein